MEHTELTAAGLTDGESKVYLSLLRLGPSTTGPVTDTSGVSRSKIYTILERLMRKGLVTFTIKGKTRHYHVTPPEQLITYVRRQQDELGRIEQTIKKIVPQLYQEQASAPRATDILVYKGFQGIRTAHERMYLHLQKGDWFFYMGIPAQQEPRYHTYWREDHRRRSRKGIISKALFNRGTKRSILENRNSYRLSEARYMPLSVETPAWFMGYKDTIVIGLQSSEGMAIEVHNKEIAKAFREYFTALWGMSSPFT